MNLRYLQLLELKIFKNLIQLFEYHHLNYFILGGTLLGAIRHKGFIPWDDDIDIGMPRNDYNKFLDLYKNKLNKELIIRNFKNDKRYKKYFTKVENINHPI